MKRKLLPVTLAAAALAALVWAFVPRPFPVDSAEVVRGRFEQTIDDDGRTRVRERYVVSAPIGGRLDRIALDPGDAVRRGQVVASLIPMVPALIDTRAESELAERVGAAEANVARAAANAERVRALLSKSRADLERTRKLAESNFVSAAQVERDELSVATNARELDAAQFEKHAAEHQLELAKAALSRSQSGWHRGHGERLDIRSPVDGVVFRVLQENEGAVALGTPLMEIADAARLEVVVDVLSSDAVQIPAGAAVHLHQYGDARPLEGRVRRVEPSGFTKVSALGVEEQRVNAIIDFTSPPELWRALGDGYRVDARIVVHARDDAILVPVGALFRDDARWAVFVVRDGRARKQLIDAPRRNSMHAAVENGLRPGERVIVYPAERVRDGMRVRELRAATSTPAGDAR